MNDSKYDHNSILELPNESINTDDREKNQNENENEKDEKISDQQEFNVQKFSTTIFSPKSGEFEDNAEPIISDDYVNINSVMEMHRNQNEKDDFISSS